MFNNDYLYDYDRIIEDAEDLMDDDYYEDYTSQTDWDDYYHNITDELVDE